MNLSKIAIGIAASICLMSNITWAADSKPKSEPKLEAVPAIPKLPNLPPKILDSSQAGSKTEDEYSKDLEQKGKERFEKLYAELKLDTREQNNLDFSEEELEKLFDALGYAEAVGRLEKMKNTYPGIKNYYIFKLINDEINEDKKQIDLNKGSLKENTSKITTIESQAKKNTTDIDLNKKSIEEHKKSIDENKKAIAVNKSEIEIYSKNVIENNNKIALNTKAIETMNKQLSSRLDNLNKSLKSGLATQSALNGLFQPYNIGKMNVSAALGGYKSHNALAVGAGFRFNKNVASKSWNFFKL